MGVLTGALAIVKKDGIAVGKMRNLRIAENIRRQDVRGLGTIIVQESPPVEHGGTVTTQFYEIDFTKSGIPDAIRRDVQTKKEWEDNILLDDTGFQLDVFKKVEDFIDPATGLRKAKLVPYAIITRMLIEQDDVDINEGQVSGRNQNFKFLDPIIRPS